MKNRHAEKHDAGSWLQMNEEILCWCTSLLKLCIVPHFRELWVQSGNDFCCSLGKHQPGEAPVVAERALLLWQWLGYLGHWSAKGQSKYWCGSEIQHCWGDVTALVWRDLLENTENARFPSGAAARAGWWVCAQDRTNLSTEQCIPSFQVTIPSFQVTTFHRDIVWENEGGKRSLASISAATGASVQPSHTCGVWVHLLKVKRCWSWESREEMEMGTVAVFSWFVQWKTCTGGEFLHSVLPFMDEIHLILG